MSLSLLLQISSFQMKMKQSLTFHWRERLTILPFLRLKYQRYHLLLSGDCGKFGKTCSPKFPVNFWQAKSQWCNSQNLLFHIWVSRCKQINIETYEFKQSLKQKALIDCHLSMQIEFFDVSKSNSDTSVIRISRTLSFLFSFLPTDLHKCYLYFIN